MTSEEETKAVISIFEILKNRKRLEYYCEGLDYFSFSVYNKELATNYVLCIPSPINRSNYAKLKIIESWGTVKELRLFCEDKTFIDEEVIPLVEKLLKRKPLIKEPSNKLNLFVREFKNAISNL